MASHLPASTTDPELSGQDSPLPDSSFPRALAPLVGRLRERQAVSDFLRNPDMRLLVLTGPGGVGKTRLALSVIEAATDAFPGGTAFVDLSPISGADQVLPSIATALGIRHGANAPLLNLINSTLRSLRFLLVIDNFEHVADGALHLPELLMSNPGLTIMVTSRSVLSVYGEHVYPVPPMTVPLVPDDIPVDTALTRSLLATDAIQLFVRRATAARSDFALTNENVRDVATICRLLDGLPLGIELAAARIGLLPPRSLAQRLQRRLPMLDDGPRDVPVRLRTMRNAISWSYDLLDPKEQAVFRRVSIFSSSWTLHAAVAVVVDDDSDLDEPGVLDLISSLIDKSLVRQVVSDAESPNFNLLQVLREFGLEQLDRSGERDELERRHARSVLELAEEAAPELIGPNQIQWLDRLASSYSDVQSAMAWALLNDPPELALGLASSLWRYGYTRGQTRQAREWVEQSLERAPARTTLRAYALNGAAVLANMERNIERSRQLQTEALDIALELGDRRVAGMAHIGLGDCAATLDDVEEATYHYQQAERIFRALGDQRNIAATLTNVANLLWSQNDLASAIDTNERARILYTNAGDRRGVAWSATNIGRIAAQQLDYVRAMPNLEQALEGYHLLGDRAGYAEALEGIALVSIGTGNYERAASLLAAADSLRRAVHHPVAPGDRAINDQMIETLRGELNDAFAVIWTSDRALSFEEVRVLVSQHLADGPLPVRPAKHPVRLERVHSLIKELGISEREIEVLTLVAAGKTDRDIAEELFIGVRTVQSHVGNLMLKLEVNARSAAVARAIRSGIIS